MFQGAEGVPDVDRLHLHIIEEEAAHSLPDRRSRGRRCDDEAEDLRRDTEIDPGDDEGVVLQPGRVEMGLAGDVIREAALLEEELEHQTPRGIVRLLKLENERDTLGDDHAIVAVEGRSGQSAGGRGSSRAAGGGGVEETATGKKSQLWHGNVQKV